MALTEQQSANLYAASGLLSGIGTGMAQEAAAINQQTGYMVNAINTLAIANVGLTKKSAMQRFRLGEFSSVQRMKA